MSVLTGASSGTVEAFIESSRLASRWPGRERFVVLESGFGSGRRFLATWAAWRADPQRSATLVYLVIEAQPPSHADLSAAPFDPGTRELADALLAAWPPLTPNLHRLSFDDGQVQLLIVVADLPRGLREVVARVDAFFLGGFDTDTDPGVWDTHACKALGRLAAPGATLVAACNALALAARLAAAGFVTPPTAAAAGPRHLTLATFAPPFEPRRAPTRGAMASASSVPRHALIVGAGLAGCAAAWALAEQGWCCTVLERHAAIATEGSGNPAGLFHGIVNAQDGRHARFNRAAAIEARGVVQRAIERHGVRGSTNGVLRLESTLVHVAMLAQLQRLGLPPGYVQALDANAASGLAGIPLSHPAWFYPGGGWVHPVGLARAFIERAGVRASVRTSVDVQALVRTATGWSLQDSRGGMIAQAEVVVLANAGDAIRLLGDAAPPMARMRGQLSVLPVTAFDLRQQPQLPIAGSGYLLPPINGEVIFGATAQRDDGDASVRPADHAINLAQLERLIGLPLDVDPQALQGRTAWRWFTADRLPVIGAVPDPHGTASGPRAGRQDQPRFVPRLPGLFTFTGLGSRGITWSALGAQVLASSISGAPAPLEASLLDAVDPARFVARRVRRSGNV